MSKLNTELIHALQKNESIEEVFALVVDYAGNIIRRYFPHQKAAPRRACFYCTPILFLAFAQILTKLIFFPCALNFASYSVRKVRDFSA